MTDSDIKEPMNSIGFVDPEIDRLRSLLKSRHDLKGDDYIKVCEELLEAFPTHLDKVEQLQFDVEMEHNVARGFACDFQELKDSLERKELAQLSAALTAGQMGLERINGTEIDLPVMKGDLEYYDADKVDAVLTHLHERLNEYSVSVTKTKSVIESMRRMVSSSQEKNVWIKPADLEWIVNLLEDAISPGESK